MSKFRMMNRYFHWRLLGADENPFERAGRRLRLTVHCPNESNLTADERDGLALIRELARLDDTRILETQSGPRWHLLVDSTPNSNGVGTVTFVAPDGTVGLWHAFSPRDWIDEAIRFRRIGSRVDPDIVALGEQLMFVEAHEQCYRDMFVTTHPELLERRDRAADANIRSLGEGLQLLGLYLRMKRKIPIRVASVGRSPLKYELGLDLFYWIATRDRLPAMWK
jgi:hypothetical protein